MFNGYLLTFNERKYEMKQSPNMIEADINSTNLLVLYLVVDTTENGDSLNLFVWETTPEACIDHWRTYYELGDELPTKIFRVPLATPKRGALNWHSEAGVSEVWCSQ